MPTFRYKAANSEGKAFSGVVDAENLERARDRIQSRGLRVLEVLPAVLPRPRRITERPPRRKAPLGTLLALALLLLTAMGALIWFDPYGWFGGLFAS